MRRDGAVWAAMTAETGEGTGRPPPGTATAALPPGGHVHLIAICGVGMSALAGMLRQRGYRVSGSDQNVYPPISTLLERWGIPVRSGFHADNLADAPDLVVVGNSVSRSNPEVAALLAGRLPYVSFPQAVGELFLDGKQPIVVAGTHGKTTSTAMLGRVLEQAGRDPSVLVGGEALDFGGNFRLGDGAAFVVEGDEYDTAFFDKEPKFVHYRPQAVLLTAVEFDHADIYRDLDHVKRAFSKLIATLPAEAPLVVCGEFPHAVEVARAGACRVEEFGFAPTAAWRAVDLADTGGEQHFAIERGGAVEARAVIGAAGRINACNALGVYAMARCLGLPPSAILPGLRAFRGVARRQEVVGDFGGVTVVDDFAHHPTAVAGAIAAMRSRFGGRRLWAVFEPRSNTSRRKVFQREYAEALVQADAVIIGGVFRKETDQVAAGEQFSPLQLVGDLAGRGVSARALSEAGEIAAQLAAEVRSGDVVLMMSNGGFGGLRGRLAALLEERFDAAR